MEFAMNALPKPVPFKRWQALVLLGLSGYAVGNLIAKLANAVEF